MGQWNRKETMKSEFGSRGQEELNRNLIMRTRRGGREKKKEKD